MFIYYPLAFLGGILSLLSPCSGAFLPVYFMLAFRQKNKLLSAALIFSIGVLITAVPIGVGFTLLANLLRNYGVLMFRIWALVLLFFGITTLFGYNPLQKNISSDQLKKDDLNKKSVLGLGLFCGLSLGTCTGPIIGAIATLSALTGGIMQSILLMSIYTLGVVTPLFVIIFSANKFEKLKNIFVKGKLFKVTYKDKEYYLHSTNVLVSILFLFLSYLFYFKGGSIGGIGTNYAFADFIFNLQDKLVEVMFLSR